MEDGIVLTKKNFTYANITVSDKGEGYYSPMIMIRTFYLDDYSRSGLYLENKNGYETDNMENYLTGYFYPNGSLRHFNVYDGKIHSYNIHAGNADYYGNEGLFYNRLLEHNINAVINKMNRRKYASSHTLSFGRYRIDIEYGYDVRVKECIHPDRNYVVKW